MNSIDPNEQSPEGSKRTLDGLERLAVELDARTYPGKAWPAVGTSARRPGAPVWKRVGWIGGIAALVAVGLHYWKTSAGQRTPAGTGPIVRVIPSAPVSPPVPRPAFDESALPRIVIVEDVDSYSIIDLNNTIPLVSFASKDSPGLDDLTPILLDPSVGPGL